MNGFDLAGRALRVGLGNDKATQEAGGGDRNPPKSQSRSYEGSAFSGLGGRGGHAGGSGGTFDRAGGRDQEKGGTSALDDMDVSGVNFNNVSRDALMRKLAREEEPAPQGPGAVAAAHRGMLKAKAESQTAPAQATRAVVLRNMFAPAE
jgi:RNA-binding protein 39